MVGLWWFRYYEELMDMQGELDSGILTDAEARKKMDSKRDEYKQKLDMLKVQAVPYSGLPRWKER